MNSTFTDPNNHVPAVAPDDSWGDVEGCLSGPIVVVEVVGEGPVTLPTAVLPPKRPKESALEGAPAGGAGEGLRIDSNVQRRLPDELEANLEVQEIDGSVVRLDPEEPAVPRMPRQITFHEKSSEGSATRQLQGEGREWGRANRFSIRWIAAISVTVVGVVVSSLLLLPRINQANAASGPKIGLVVEHDENVEGTQNINDMLGRQDEALQIFRKFASARIVNDVFPLLRDRKDVEPLLSSVPWAPIVPPHWEPSGEINWLVFDDKGQVFGILNGTLPDYSNFNAYLVLLDGQLYLDWKASTGYSTASYDEMAKGRGDTSEIRGSVDTSGFYTDVYPEAEYQSYQLFSPDGEAAIWLYARRGDLPDADLNRALSKGTIIKESPGNKKVTLRLSRHPDGGLPNQWFVEELLHKDWITL